MTSATLSLAARVHTVRSTALDALQQTQAPDKARGVEEAYAQMQEIVSDSAQDICSGLLTEPANLPGRPARPKLLAHLDMPQRALRAPDGLARLLHSVAHIEFNAIDLALDAVWRFDLMPLAYYADWLQVAAEEAQHFAMLDALLKNLGYGYGDFPAHTGLWDMAERTKNDIVARMALVPRTLEARGLDATPPMQAKLRSLATPQSAQAVAVLDVILRDEVGHVAIGNRWYRYVCERAGLQPIAHYRVLCRQYRAPGLRAPINVQARLAAGFTAEELATYTPA